MADKEIVFRLWEDADESQILELFLRGYGDMEIAYADYFDWEYRRNPAGRATIGCGLTPDGRVVTALAVVPTPVRFRGTLMTAGMLVNGVTLPDFRGRNLFPRCSNLVCEVLGQAGIALSYGLPNPNSYPGLTRKVGYADIGRACLLIRPYEPAALLSARFPAARRLGLGGLDTALVRGLLKKPRQKVAVRTASSFDELPMANLREDVKLAVETDVAWLNWRYIDIPRRRYHLVVAGERDDTRGVAVYRIADWNNVRIGTVNDLFLSPDCGPDVVESLMSHVFGECEASRCAATFCLVSPSSRKLEMLKRAGFWGVPSRFEPQPFSVILRGHTVSTSDITVADMEVSFGIYDIF